MFLSLMSVDHILSFLNKAIVRLRDLANAKAKQAEMISEELATLRAKRDSCYKEEERALRIANRIEDLVE